MEGWGKCMNGRSLKQGVAYPIQTSLFSHIQYPIHSGMLVRSINNVLKTKLYLGMGYATPCFPPFSWSAIPISFFTSEKCFFFHLYWWLWIMIWFGFHHVRHHGQLYLYKWKNHFEKSKITRGCIPHPYIFVLNTMFIDLTHPRVSQMLHFRK